jgi:methyl-accepting chemotaxis protein
LLLNNKPKVHLRGSAFEQQRKTRMLKLRLAPKIFAAILIVSASTIAVAAMSFVALSRIEGSISDLKEAEQRRQMAGHATVSFIGYALALEQIARTASAEEIRVHEQLAENEYGELRNWLDLLEARLTSATGKSEMEGVRQTIMSMRATQSNIQMLTHIGDVKSAEAELAKQEPAVARGKEQLGQLERRSAGSAEAAAELAMKEQGDAKGWIALVTMFGISIALLTALSIVITNVTSPLRKLSAVVTALARGDTEVEMPVAHGRDEIAEMTRCVATFRDNAIQVRQLTEQQADRARDAEAERIGLMQSLAEEFDSAVSSIIAGTRTAAEQLTLAASAMENGARASSEQAIAVSQSAHEASTNVATVATAAEQLDVSVAEVASQVLRSTTIAQRASDEAIRTTGNVQAQSEAAQRIGDVVELINSLAAQTNLLALNATIEAARAGEAGRGFAVVASEVKSLAEQTARATDQIGLQVNDIRAATSASSAAMGAIVSTIEEMAGISGTIAAAVEEQRASTTEIARNVREAARGTDAVSETIEQVSEASVRTGAAATQVKSLADTIADQANTLRMSVDHFLESLRGEDAKAA